MQLITPYLEDLITKGVAQFETWTVATPGAQLQIPKNKTAIILGFNAYTFCDGSRLLNYNYKLLTDGKVYNYLNRGSFAGINDPLALHTFNPAYIRTNKDVFLNIVRLPDSGSLSSVIGLAPNKTEQPAPPQGLGTLNGGVTTDLSVQIVPESFTVSPYKGTSAPTINFANGFEIPVSPTSKIQNITTVASRNGQFPWVTVFYVLINKKELKE